MWLITLSIPLNTLTVKLTCMGPEICGFDFDEITASNAILLTRLIGGEAHVRVVKVHLAFGEVTVQLYWFVIMSS